MYARNVVCDAAAETKKKTSERRKKNEIFAKKWSCVNPTK